MTIISCEGRDLFEIAESPESVEDVRFLTNMGMMDYDDDPRVCITPCGRRSVKGVDQGSPRRWIRP